MSPEPAGDRSGRRRKEGLRSLLSLILPLVCLLHASGARSASLSDLSAEEIAARADGDSPLVARYRQGLRDTVDFAAAHPAFAPAGRDAALPGREERETIRSTWRRFLDYFLALDALDADWDRWALVTARHSREKAFLVHRAAGLARYRFAMEFIRVVEKNPPLVTVIDEEVPDLGVAGGSYSRLKFHYLNVGRATEFAALETLRKTMDAVLPTPLEDAAGEDAAAILRFGAKEGPLLTLDNAMAVVGRTGQDAFFPVQAGVSEWMGDTKIRRRGLSLITREQIAALPPRLLPGDILLERREWYLSNVGIPGFWPHAALYLGTPDERRAFFSDPEVRSWVREQGQEDGDLEGLLRARYPRAYADALAPGEGGHPPRLLEAMSEGVVFTTIEHSAEADSLAVLRPRLTAREKAAAIVHAFRYRGRPYDFNFDFATDASLVCTELVYKAYEPGGGTRGLRFPLTRVLGRTVTPANELVRQFDETWGGPDQQYDLILFLDGNESQRRAVEAGLDRFRQSWRRPKWHVLTK